MSGPRAAIARLSLAVRILLYTALLIAIGYIGFSFSSGYVAMPGDVTFTLQKQPGPGGVAAFPGGGRGNVIYMRTNVVCEKTIIKSDKDGEAGTTTAAASDDCVTAAPINFSGKQVIRLNDGDVDITIERNGDGKDAKGHITLKTGGKTIESDFTSSTLPAEIASALPADKKTKIEELLKNPPVPPMPPGAPQIIIQGEAPLPPEAAPPGAPPMPPGPPLPPGNFSTFTPPPGGDFEVMTLPGPALLQQQLEGHTAIRATLVGVTIALVVLAIVQLERLLAHFQRAELFSSRNSGLLRNIGLLLVLIAFVQAASTLLPAILVNALHPVLIGALGPHLFLVFAGLVLVLLAQVVSEGSRLEDEAAHTV